jgi:hypothetical protein
MKHPGHTYGGFVSTISDWGMTGREGPTVPVQLCGGLQSPNRTVTPADTTIIRTAGGAMCIDNASDTTSSELSRIFHQIEAVNLRGIKY